VVSYGIITDALDGVPGYEIYAKQLTIFGSRGTGGRYEEAMRLLALGKVQVEPMITHTLPLDDAERGFSIMINRLEDALRVIFIPSKEGFQVRGQ
jgi:threonine dehydrogenase-like Zn-dependent dehydrogenase